MTGHGQANGGFPSSPESKVKEASGGWHPAEHAGPASPKGPENDRRILHRLILFGLVYNTIEGLLSVGAGIVARSIVLVGFGLDSWIEATASYAALGFMRDGITEEGETRLSRLVGWTFLALAAYVLVQSLDDLIHQQDVSPSLLGLIVTSTSLVVMPVLGFWKLRLARRLGSRGLQAEAKETVACSYLSFFAVLGVAVRYLGGPSWVDPVAALLMIPWLVREGIEGRRPKTNME